MTIANTYIDPKDIITIQSIEDGVAHSHAHVHPHHSDDPVYHTKAILDEAKAAADAKQQQIN